MKNKMNKLEVDFLLEQAKTLFELSQQDNLDIAKCVFFCQEFIKSFERVRDEDSNFMFSAEQIRMIPIDKIKISEETTYIFEYETTERAAQCREEVVGVRELGEGEFELVFGYHFFVFSHAKVRTEILCRVLGEASEKERLIQFLSMDYPYCSSDVTRARMLECCWQRIFAGEKDQRKKVASFFGLSHGSVQRLMTINRLKIELLDYVAKGLLGQREIVRLNQMGESHQKELADWLGSAVFFEDLSSEEKRKEIQKKIIELCD